MTDAYLLKLARSRNLTPDQVMARALSDIGWEFDSGDLTMEESDQGRTCTIWFREEPWIEQGELLQLLRVAQALRGELRIASEAGALRLTFSWTKG